MGKVGQLDGLGASLTAHRARELHKTADAQRHIGRSTHQHALAASHGQRLLLVRARDDVDRAIFGGKVNHLAVGFEGRSYPRDKVQIHRHIAGSDGQPLHAHHGNHAGGGREGRPLQALSCGLARLGRSQQQRKAHVLQRQASGLVARQGQLLALAIGRAPVGAANAGKCIQARGTK